ncbi:gliding motility lipoprotein GldJ [Flavobacteriaceae bacterium LSUCC0859]|jgi:gliding motility-associated lipoprotein GldJ|nr:gliding motility lipoprotein GldJ [Flavobacteriaceae bacterium LSUCC0859]
MKRYYLYIIALSSLLIGNSCNKSKSGSGISRGTGWKVNVDQGKNSFGQNFKEQETAPGLIFIEGGTFTMGKAQDDVMKDWNNTPTQQQVQSFYMDETEVTNEMYLEYLDYLKFVYPPNEDKFKGIYESALPDTLVWRNRLSYNEDLVINYLRHPAFSQFPVVGVSWLQATQYAKWRTDRVNEAILEREGFLNDEAKFSPVNGENPSFNTEAYLNNPALTYGGKIDSLQGKMKKDTINVYAKISYGVLLPEYRLPTEVEWEYAAQAQTGDREYNNYKGRNKYPWDGKYTRNNDKRGMGDQLANFKVSKGDYGGIAGWSDDGGSITVETKFHPPNSFGLYGMGGNVAEWVADVYRPIIDDDISDFNYFRGNIFEKPAIDQNGNIIINETIADIDTLANGKINVGSLPGSVKKVPIDEKETFLRTNFSESDNRSYRDGDLASSRQYYENIREGEESKKMYNAPESEISVNDQGELVRKYDKASHRNTLINDEVRVYKGGSWKDRAFWLDPAQRRYLPQYMATDFIGFRCAMSRVGSKSKSQNKTPRNKSKRSK